MRENQVNMLESQISPAISYPLAGYATDFDWKNFFHKLAIIATGAIVIFLIVLLKSKTAEEFLIDPYFFSYTIFVTTFVFSRIISAMLYDSSFSGMAGKARSETLFRQNEYEPTVAFVIPCKNEEREIGETVIQCYQTDYPREKLEVIVVNDGSADRTLLILKELQKFYPSLKIIDWPNQGKRWAMAAGFRVSQSEIIVQLDSDSQIDPVTFRELIAPFKNPKIAAVCAHGIPKNADQNIITRMQAAYYFMSFRILKAAESAFNTVFCCSGCCSAYRKKSVMPILYQWLSESFLGLPVTWGDDRALTSWLLKRGEKTVYNSRALAYTIVPANWRQLFKQQLRWKKSWIINACLTSRFIWKKQPFVAFFYYFPLILISLLAPIMAFRALIFAPLSYGVLPLFHIAGVLLITALIALYYRFIDNKNKFWPYLFLWSILNLFALTFILIWAAIRIQDREWGTR